MKNLVKMAFVAIALLMSITASAQSCVLAPYTMNGGPQRCWGDASGQVVSGQQQRIFIPDNLPSGGFFSTNINGMQKQCKLLDRVFSGFSQAVVAGFFGYVGEKVLGRQDHKLSQGMFVAGLFMGATITCDPDVMGNFTQRQQIVQLPQQMQATPTLSCQNDPGSKLGILNLPGHEKNGQKVCARPGDMNVTFF